MKITIISHDFWGYDGYIAEALRRNGTTAHHIRLSDYRHPNLLARGANAFSKFFYKKNLKDLNRQKLILKELQKLGFQDQILIINPDYFPAQLHAEIKKHTSRYLAFLYDSVAANPIDKVLLFFDEIFSFDEEDCQKMGFTQITNYNYLDKHEAKPSPRLDLIYIGSFDDRISRLDKIAEKLETLNKKYEFHIIGKKAWKKIFAAKKGFLYSSKRVPHHEIPNYYSQSKAILDLVRNGQSGLSFRFFEAMALGKKIVTDNKAVRHYDFFNPQNIWVLDEDLQPGFFESPYIPIPEGIYSQYTVDSWVKAVFKLP